MKTISGNDHRKLTRFPVNVKVIDKDSGESLGYTSNMHVEGMMLMSFNPIQVATDYRIQLEFLDQYDELIEIQLSARCLWCKPADNPDIHHSGFYFISPTQADQDQIVDMIRTMTT